MFGSITIDIPSYDLGSFMWLPWCPWVPGCHHRGQVAKQMVMTLGMSPEIGQRLLGGQQGGGPFMGRDLPGDFRDFSEDFEKKT